MPRLIATWNPARGVWETIQPSLLCGHLVPFSATWPTSGSMLSGRVRAPLTSAPPTAGSGSGSSPGRLLATPTRLDLLPTPEAKLADSGPDWGRAGRQVDNAGGGGDGTVVVQSNLYLDGREIYSGQQVQTLKYQQRNGRTGLSRTGAA